MPGCAARPESIIDGVIKALDVLEKKKERMKQGLPPEEKGWAIANIRDGKALAAQEARIAAQLAAEDAAKAAKYKALEEEWKNEQ